MRNKFMLGAVLGAAAVGLSSCSWLHELLTNPFEDDIGREEASVFVTDHYSLSQSKTYTKQTLTWSVQAEPEGHDEICKSLINQCLSEMNVNLTVTEVSGTQTLTGNYATQFLNPSTFDTVCEASPFYDVNGSVYSGEITSDNVDQYSQSYLDYYLLNEEKTELTFVTYIGLGTLVFYSTYDTFDADGSLYYSKIDFKGWSVEDESTSEETPSLTGTIERTFSN